MKLVVLLLIFIFSSCITDKNSLSGDFATPEDNTVAELRAIKQFAIYYAYPSSLNSSINQWDNNLVSQDFSKYKEIVWGGGVADPSHGDYANSVEIANNIKNSTSIYGYITIGNNAGNPYTDIELKTQIDQWFSLSEGVKGIFLDEAGNA